MFVRDQKVIFHLLFSTGFLLVAYLRNKIHIGQNSDHFPKLINSLKPFGMPRPVLYTEKESVPLI